MKSPQIGGRRRFTAWHHEMGADFALNEADLHLISRQPP
jgi:hypothetical protein